MAYGVHIATSDIDALMTDLESWFSEREDVHLIGEGVSSKTDTPFAVVRFGRVVDPLFVALLNRDPSITEYSVFELLEPTDDDEEFEGEFEEEEAG